MYQPVLASVGAEIHSSERRKPSEVSASQADIIIIGEPPRSGSDVLKLMFGCLMDGWVLGQVRNACTVR
ncbi:hypothetical protein GGP41_007734 [Bipolaris sorokiniana]|uniref:Uncharacterized protein n=1 Tax=Cochliobolus sativus TaxID=45130 RepID=A0A8H6DXR5_COCSA|nr:hypothetical protein GGP41_007734 [Bipolaris sorokiniana]